MDQQYTYNTPIGYLTIRENGSAVTRISYGTAETAALVQMEESVLIRETIRQLREYLDGKRRQFDLPLSPAGTDFQKRVWAALRAIPYGETRSYKELAKAAGCAGGCRAVGQANHNNPIMIVIPCHRVIRADGSLGGYACGLEVKKRLLELEGSYPRAREVRSERT